MKAELILRLFRLKDFGPYPDDMPAPPHVMEPFEKAALVTGDHAEFHTGQREPVLILRDIHLTRTKLLEIVIKMGQMELEDPRRRR